MCKSSLFIYPVGTDDDTDLLSAQKGFPQRLPDIIHRPCDQATQVIKNVEYIKKERVKIIILSSSMNEDLLEKYLTLIIDHAYDTVKEIIHYENPKPWTIERFIREFKMTYYPSKDDLLYALAHKDTFYLLGI